MKLPDDLPDDLVGPLTRYFEAEWRGGDAQVQRCDVILALLRLGHRKAAEQLLGKPVTVCPPWVPPRSPAPVAKLQGPRVRRVGRNPCLPTTDAFQRFRQIRVGMTQDQLESRGITKRDIRLWRRAGHLEIA